MGVNARRAYQLRKTLGEVSAASSSPMETLPQRGFRLAKQSALTEVEEAIGKPRAWQHFVLAAAHAMSDKGKEALRYLNSSPPGRVRSWV